MSTMDNLKIINLMGEEYLLMMLVSMKDSFWMDKRMDMENSLGLMDLSSKAIIKKTRNMVKESFTIRKEPLSEKVFGSIITLSTDHFIIF